MNPGFRDWRGVAELAGLTSENMAYLETKSNHLQELLKLLPTVSSSRLQTVKDLKAFLSMIDRYDVVDDAHDLFCIILTTNQIEPFFLFYTFVILCYRRWHYFLSIKDKSAQYQ